MSALFRVFVLTTLVIATQGTPLLAANFQAGQDAYSRGDYAEALRVLRPLAEQGHARAQFRLGFMHANGRGVPRNDAEAVKWYRRAARQDHAGAQNNLGFMYDKGRGGPQDVSRAATWYRKAAEQGHVAAQTNLGFMYEKGRGVPQDDAEAVKWYRRAAEQGHAKAKNRLDAMLSRPGVPAQADRSNQALIADLEEWLVGRWLCEYNSSVKAEVIYRANKEFLLIASVSFGGEPSYAMVSRRMGSYEIIAPGSDGHQAAILATIQRISPNDDPEFSPGEQEQYDFTRTGSNSMVDASAECERAVE